MSGLVVLGIVAAFLWGMCVGMVVAVVIVVRRRHLWIPILQRWGNSRG